MKRDQSGQGEYKGMFILNREMEVTIVCEEL